MSLLRLFQARLSYRIVLWIFASIVGIEFIVLIPSYYLEQQRQLEKLEIDSNASIRAITSLANNNMYSQSFKKKVTAIAKDSPALTGLALYGNDGTLIASYGEVPELIFSKLDVDKVTRRLSEDRTHYDIAWSVNKSNERYFLVGRHV